MELCFGCYGQTCGEEPFTDLVCEVYLGQPGSCEAGSREVTGSPELWQFSKGRDHNVLAMLGAAPHSGWTVALQQISMTRAREGKIRRAKLKAVCKSRAGKRGEGLVGGKAAIPWELLLDREYSKDDAGQGEVRSSSSRKMRLLLTYYIITFKAFFIHLLCVPCVEGQRIICGSWFSHSILLVLGHPAFPAEPSCQSVTWCLYV